MNTDPFDIIDLLLDRDGANCKACGIPLTDRNFAIDNTSPERGGESCDTPLPWDVSAWKGKIALLRLVCRQCNAKTTATDIDWFHWAYEDSRLASSC